MAFVARRRDSPVELRQLRKYDFKPSDNLRKSDDAEVNITGGSYYKIKTITFDPSGVLNSAKLRIKFDIHAGSGGGAYGKIYKNGVAFGAEHSTSSTAYVTFSDDLSPWAVGDTIELWGYWVTSAAAYVRNFRVYADIVEMSYVASW